MSQTVKYPDIAARLRLVMADAGCPSSAALARAIGEDPTRVRNWTNGHSRPMIEDAIRLKRLFRISLDWLYDDDPGGLPHAMYLRLVRPPSP